jgi:hypothetical protein
MLAEAALSLRQAPTGLDRRAAPFVVSRVYVTRAVTFAASASRPVECSTRHLIELVYFESRTEIEM